MSTGRISVVVPFYNNGDVLEDCLRSVAAQTFTDLQVIMVDDGSTDGGPDVARRWVAADQRFTLVQTPNGGPGAARNAGVAHATGEFLAFVDGDDMLPPHAYELLLHALESSGSDFVSGAVRRISTSGIHPSALHQRAIKGRKTATHVTRSPELLYDISVWNKLFRRSFWDAHQLCYPEGMVWEDLQLMTRAHVLATAVDVIGDQVYLWRERAAGELSITQNRTDIQNLRDRVTALRAIDDFLRGHAPRRTLRQHQRKALVNDLWLYVRDLTRVDVPYLTEYLDLVGGYLGTVSRRVWRSLPATHKLAYYLTSRQLPDELLRYVSWLLDQRIATFGVTRRFGRLRADLPVGVAGPRADAPVGDDRPAVRPPGRRLRVPGWVLRPHWRDLDPFVQVESVEWRRGSLVISGLAYVPSVDAAQRRNTSKIVILRPRRRFRPPVIALATSFKHPRANALAGQETYDYTWAGFRAEISSRWFRVAGRWLTGDWDCFILVRGHGVWRPARLHSPAFGAGRPGVLAPAPGLQVRPTWVGRHLRIGVVRTPARLAAFECGGGMVTLEVALDPQPGETPAESAELVLVQRRGAVVRPFPASARLASGGGLVIRGGIPVAELVPELAGAAAPATAEGAGPAGLTAASGSAAVTAPADPPAPAPAWDLYVRTGGRARTQVTFPDSLAEGRYPDAGREVAVERGGAGQVTLARRRPRAIITGHTWDDQGRLAVTGTCLAAVGEPVELRLRSLESSAEHVVACQRDGERFSAVIPVAVMPTFGVPLPLRDGPWEVTGAACDHTTLAGISHHGVEVGPKRYAFTTAGYDTPVITAEPRLRLSEQSLFSRRVIRKAVYPVQARRPLWDAVLFLSWAGKQCADNPLGIAEEMRRRGDHRERIWVVADYCTAVPDGSRVVLTGTEEYFEALARCRYIVSNDDMPQDYRKRDGQTYLQTWHGTPLKRVGFDIGTPQFASGGAYLDRLAADVARWDLLLSQNPFSTPILRRAFRFEGEICEYGYPRNDLLARDPDQAAVIRRRLGLPDGKRVVLYAPTWRDNQFYASGKYRFDLRLDLDAAWRALGEDHVVLLRGHHHAAHDVSAGTRPGFVRNVTGYPDVAELMLITDVLVTDYSSMMFDFAVTGRPMVFFAYDLARYRDQLRGFCFDFEAEAPGPVVTTSEDVLAAIRESASGAGRFAAAYRSFAATYCPLDDGKAGARVCDRLFGPGG